MASIENRSRIQVTVKNRDNLSKDFAYNDDKSILQNIPPLTPPSFNTLILRAMLAVDILRRYGLG